MEDLPSTSGLSHNVEADIESAGIRSQELATKAAELYRETVGQRTSKLNELYGSTNPYDKDKLAEERAAIDAYIAKHDLKEADYKKRRRGDPDLEPPKEGSSLDFEQGGSVYGVSWYAPSKGRKEAPHVMSRDDEPLYHTPKVGRRLLKRLNPSFTQLSVSSMFSKQHGGPAGNGENENETSPAEGQHGGPAGNGEDENETSPAEGLGNHDGDPEPQKAAKKMSATKTSATKTSTKKTSTKKTSATKTSAPKTSAPQKQAERIVGMRKSDRPQAPRKP
jgi:hypothetical protein